MVISHSKKFIFIHIYKTAGTSVTVALQRYADNSYSYRQPLTLLKYQLGIYPHLHSQSMPAHCTAAQIKEFLGNRYNKYFTFCFVRNPWDWQVSLYNFMLKDTTHYQHNFIRSLGSFENYLRWRCSKEIRYQSDFIFDNSKRQLVDFVGRYENLNSDFCRICDLIGIERLELPRTNVSSVGDYKSYYTDELRLLVQNTFNRDIERFGYSF